MANMAKAASSSSKQRDAPNYKAPALRWPFLAALLLLLCALAASLEYLLRVWPHAQDASAIPKDSLYTPFQKRRVGSYYLPASRQPAHKTLPSATRPLAFPISATGPLTTIAPRAAAVLPSSRYVATTPISTFITTVDRWYAQDPDNSFHRTPLFPGDDDSNKCVYHHKGIVVTQNDTGCPVVLGLDLPAPLPDGLMWADWLPDDYGIAIAFLVDTDSHCYENIMEDWYSPQPDVINCTDPHESRCRAENFEAGWEGDFYWGHAWSFSGFDGSGEDLFESCILAPDGGSIDKEQVNTALPHRSVTELNDQESVRASILFMFAALLHRVDDGRKLLTMLYWHNPGSDWTGEDPGEDAVLLHRFALIFDPSSSSSDDDNVSTIAPTVVPSTLGVANAEAVNLILTAEPPTSSSLESPKTLRGASTRLRKPSTTPYKYVYIPGTMQRETATQLTHNGEVTTSIITYRISTSYLAAIPPGMAAPSLTTMTGPRGQPTATTHTFPRGLPILVSTLTTLFNPSGSPTATVQTSAPPTSRVVTRTNRQGVPTATETLFPVIPDIPGATPADDLVLISNVRHSNLLYFAVYFLPMLLTAILLVPIQILDAEIKLLMPYRLLTRGAEQGVDAAEALCLGTSGFKGRLAGWRILFRYGDVLPVLSDALGACATVLVALSGEAIGMRLRGSCLRRNVSTCMISLAAFPGPARAAQGLLGTMIVLVMVIGWVLNRWRSGVAAHPTSLASVCALLQISDTVELLRRGVPPPPSGKKSHEARETLRGSQVRIGWVANDKRAEAYGLTFVRAGPRLLLARAHTRRNLDCGAEERGKKVKLYVPVAERVSQGVFLFFLCGLLTMVLYYQNTIYEDPSESPFEAFMDSQEFGVVALFAVLGMLVTFGWEHLDRAFAATAIYLHMSRQPQSAAQSVLEARATNPFTRLWRAVRRRDALTASIVIANILGKFLPVLLSGIPFKSTQTWRSQQICGWTTVSLLSLMILILLVYMRFAQWPELPVPPDSLAGVIYYVCNSQMLKDFERLSMLGTRERDRRVERMARRYSFGWITGASGERRIACDYAEGGQGFEMRSLAPLGFGVGGKMKPK
ncbi:hypothetical protein B0T14DRAFT_580404 [Immersiella caudata]|uniref:Uncharacterized protein n=1 Tax=Immersiella caudata TaxID=314043 RepID=A0AA39WVE5_9PEZI|nr:hypothetical protein B0T14DRAFT_580404 [Immersiella caudata]